MGHIIETTARARGIEITARYWDENPFLDTERVREEIRETDVLVEFSTPGTVFSHIQTGLSLGKSMVVGTTGWGDRLNDVEKLVRKSGAGLVHASNFSLGINLFYRIAEHAASLLCRFNEYDPFVEEAHHQFKLDAPSGTALVLKEILQRSYTGKEVPVTSVRAGYIPGTHRISMDSAVDTIRLEHCARSREGLAEGAVMAAVWIAGKKGLFSFSEVLDRILEES